MRCIFATRGRRVKMGPVKNVPNNAAIDRSVGERGIVVTHKGVF